MMAAQPILVTGSPRSGTTWTGQMLAQSPQAAYIQAANKQDYYAALRKRPSLNAIGVVVFSAAVWYGRGVVITESGNE